MTTLTPALLKKVLHIRKTPRPLEALCDDYAEEEGDNVAIAWTDVRQALDSAENGDEFRSILNLRLADWDHQEVKPWTDGTLRNTDERRVVLLKKLGIVGELLEYINTNMPFRRIVDPVVASNPNRTRPDWYDVHRTGGRPYWDGFRAYLEQRWPASSVISLDMATDDVLENLADPNADAEQRKGLVVGYVQSGKTANLTGVIAKSIDAGYRLIIVMSGTTNLLRAQTQRRIDKELVGTRQLNDAVIQEESYKYAADWDDFNTYEYEPFEERPELRIVRLTGYANDLTKGATIALESSSNVNILVIKKNTAPLKRLIAALTARGGGEPLNLPTLIIDDESDQASLNANPPSMRRTAINRRIVELRAHLSHCQYIGYTATPFANVFVNPLEDEDLFPSDFIISLPRPPGYMGASAFHDLDGVDEGELSKQQAHVRDIEVFEGTDGEQVEDEAALRKAIDSFVLTGALKLFRVANGAPASMLKHHTMLIHTSHLNADHDRLNELANEIFVGADYWGNARSFWDLYGDDFRDVTAALDPEMPQPRSFDELAPHLAECLDRVAEGDSRTLIVNGSDNGEDPDFDIKSVWKILIGGAKLSRGYTVEGLTVTYFARTPGAADTLMQMGRWFGFRSGYRDLIRVFLTRGDGTSRNRDVYANFEGLVRDEEGFRAEIMRYKESGYKLKPGDMPPLVVTNANSLPPTSNAKMRWADLRSKNYGGRLIAPTLIPVSNENRKANRKLIEGVLSNADLAETPSLTNSEGKESKVLIGRVGIDAVVHMFEKFIWSNNSRPVEYALGFLENRDNKIDPEIDDFVVMVPRSAQLPTLPIAGHDVPIRIRSYDEESTRVGVFGEPVHRRLARDIVLAGADVGEPVSLYRRSRQGAVVFYFTAPTDEERELVLAGKREPIVGFEVLFPENGSSEIMAWSADAGKQE